jgi:ABC-2 type transport system permease protein
MSVSMTAQVRELAHRSILQTLRQPAMIGPPIIFPLIFVAINTSGLDAATNLPGFPADSYLDFAIVVPFIQGAMFALVNAGTAIARDIETGFFSRLGLTPMRRSALLMGHLAGVLTVSLISAAIYFVVGLAAGMDFKAGVGGVPVLLALALLIALAFSALGAVVGVRTGSGQAVQGFFPLFFVLLFLSSSNLPRDLIEQDWFRTIATYNPVSYLVEGVRSLIIYGWDGEALALGFGFAILISAGAVVLAAVGMRERMMRT